MQSEVGDRCDGLFGFDVFGHLESFLGVFEFFHKVGVIAGRFVDTRQYAFRLRFLPHEPVGRLNKRSVLRDMPLARNRFER